MLYVSWSEIMQTSAWAVDSDILIGLGLDLSLTAKKLVFVTGLLPDY